VQKIIDAVRKWLIVIHLQSQTIELKSAKVSAMLEVAFKSAAGNNRNVVNVIS
jgi:hypothetical protein